MAFSVSSNNYQSDNFENIIHHARTSSRSSPTMSYSRPSSSGSTASSTSPFLSSRLGEYASPKFARDDYRYSRLSDESAVRGKIAGMKKTRSKVAILLYFVFITTCLLLVILLFRVNDSNEGAQASAIPPSEDVSKQIDSASSRPTSQAHDQTWDFASKVDIVYTWVNGSDLAYQKLRAAYGGAKSVGTGRDRDNDDLRYSLRSVAEFMPWSKGSIYVVSPSPPDWLDLAHPRIQWIDQDSLVPKEAQPTFSSNAIEPYLHLIPNLTETFILFNDDNFVNKPIHPSTFFTPEGGIKLFFEPHVIKDEAPPFGQVGEAEDRGDQNMKARPTGNVWLTSVRNTKKAIVRAYGDDNGKLARELRFLKHAPFVMSRAAYFGMHTRFNRQIRLATSHKFRSRTDVITPLLHHAYVQYEGSYCCGIQYETISAEEATRSMALVIWTSDSDLNERVLEELEAKKSDLSFFTMNDSMENSKFETSRIAQDRMKRFYRERFGGLKGVFEKKD